MKNLFHVTSNDEQMNFVLLKYNQFTQNKNIFFTTIIVVIVFIVECIVNANEVGHVVFTRQAN